MTDAQRFHFPRPDLAERLAAQCTRDVFSGGLSGLFLAAPRRTGKSTFLRRDLVPALIAAGKFPICVDLWEERGTDPARVLKSALERTLDALGGATGKALNAARIQRISVLGFAVGLTDPQPFSGSLTEALVRIGELAQRDVVLIVDEAQEALASESGVNAMFSLKAARDAMNQRDEGSALFLILTGSHSDKLAALVIDRRAPFYGGSVRTFPTLGVDFAEAVAERMNTGRAEGAQISAGSVAAAFETLSQRPEALIAVLSEEVLVSDLSGEVPDVVRAAKARRQKLWDDLEGRLAALTAPQRALFELMAEHGPAFAPYTEDSLARIAAKMGRDTVSKGTVQTALSALRAKEFIWQPAQGQYIIEDQDMLSWWRERGTP